MSVTFTSSSFIQALEFLSMDQTFRIRNLDVKILDFFSKDFSIGDISISCKCLEKS